MPISLPEWRLSVGFVHCSICRTKSMEQTSPLEANSCTGSQKIPPFEPESLLSCTLEPAA